MRSLAKYSFVLLACILSGPLRADDPPSHWAFRAVPAVEIPKVKNTAWVHNPIDAFIAARHEARGFTPATEADRRTLIRRLSLDLVGLPPTPEEIDAFLNDRSSDAYDKLVDRLLASPHYGERWGRHWLDLARWAESEGYESNHPRLHAWRYRDYLVASFNRDKPFDRFLTEQIAGDELEPYADENVIATGFLAAARLSSNEEDKARQRNDVLVDVANCTASVFLGLTLHCAQCHSHKLEPLTLRDYYRFQGFFLKGQPVNLALRDPGLVKAWEAAKPAEYDPALKLYQVLYDGARERLITQARKALSPEMVKAIETPLDKRTDEEEKLAREARLKFQLTPARIEKALREEDRPLYTELKKTIEGIEKRVGERPQTFAYYSPVTSPHRLDVLPMKGFYPLPFDADELSRLRPRSLRGGEVHEFGAVLDVGWPAVFGPTPADAVAKRPRIALAKWMTDPKHPLTARVWANRVWQYHFGRGIVATPSDFGTKGSPPSHPELLDWLATELVKHGWSTKHIHRLIVTSSTYRQSSRANAANAQIDPENVALWRWSPRRLEAEAIRDSMLAVSGELDDKAGGPSDPDAAKSKRQGLYLFQKRESVPMYQALFDGTNAAAESCPKRSTTTVPLQALYLLNNDFSASCGKSLAKRVVGLAGTDHDRQIETAFVLTLGRKPDEKERAAATAFFRRVESDSALEKFCQAILNLNEFVCLE